MGALTESIKARFDALRPVLDERSRRLWAGAEAKAIGRGGIARVVESTGLSRDTVRAGLKEVQAGVFPAERARGERLRRRGGGRKALAEHDPELLVALERKLDPVTRGDPMGPLCWTCRSAARLAAELRSEGHAVSEPQREPPAACAGVQPAGEQQDAGRAAASGPGCAIPAYLPAGPGVPGCRAAGGFGRYEEEGTGGAVPQRRAGVVSARAAGGGAGA